MTGTRTLTSLALDSRPYRSFAAAILRSAFEETRRPPVGIKTSSELVRLHRLQEWLWLFSDAAEQYSEGIELNLALLRAEAWERGTLVGNAAHGRRGAAFKSLPGIESIYPAGPTGGAAGDYRYPPWPRSQRDRVKVALILAQPGRGA